jgi:hypothetical protein
MNSSSIANRISRALVLMLLAVGTTDALAQKAAAFSDLEKHVHRQVTVDTEEGQVRGELLRVEERRLVVYDSGTPKTISRESIKKVTRHKSRHSAAWIAGMSAAGLGMGFLIGFRAFDDATNANGKVAAASGAGAGAGAALGYGLSRIGTGDEVVYRAE